MEAPEKIYLFESRSHDGLSAKWLPERLEDTDIEYTRTDAFLNKVQNFFHQSHHLFNLDGMELHNFIEDFRNYMKVE